MGSMKVLLIVGLALWSAPVAGQPGPARHDSLWFAVSTADKTIMLLASENGYLLRRADGSLSEFTRVPGLGLHYADQKFLFETSAGIDLILVNNLGGLTLQLQGEQLVRIDRNQLTRMNITAHYFVHRDTIFTHGGYGFWSARNLLSYLNKESGTWDIVPPSASGQIPPGICNHLIHHADDFLYVYAGSTVNALDPTVFEFQESLWRYEISTKTWTRQGKIHEALRFNNEGQIAFQSGNQQFVFPVRNLVALIDFPKNELTLYEPTSLLIDLYQKRHAYGTHYGDGKFLYLWKRLDNKSLLDFPHQSEFLAVDIKDLINDPGITEDLIEHSFTPWWMIVFPLAGALFFLAFRKKQPRRDKIKLTSDGFQFRNNDHPLSKESLALIRLLLESSKPVENIEVLNIVSIPSLNLSHNTRVKNQLVDKTNIQLKTILGVEEDIILCNRLPTDKRVRTYDIRREYFG